MTERLIAFDTETTGLSHAAGDRVVELGAVEIVNNLPTGNNFHAYISPGRRRVDEEAVKVHGLTDDFLRDKPSMREVMPQFLDYVGDGTLVIHNARFDMGFMNNECALLRLPPIANKVMDTLDIARSRNPFARNTLDALCTRYGVDRTSRTLHGALIDADLLAQVFIKMTGRDQLALGDQSFDRDETSRRAAAPSVGAVARPTREARPPVFPSDAEAGFHAAFLESHLKNSIWSRFIEQIG